MPRAEQNLSPRGQAYGTGVAQQSFLAQTQPQPATGPQTAPAAPAAAPPGFADQDILEALLTPTDRPDEPVGTGLDRMADARREDMRAWLPVLRALATRPGVPAYVKELAIYAGSFYDET